MPLLLGLVLVKIGFGIKIKHLVQNIYFNKINLMYYLHNIIDIIDIQIIVIYLLIMIFLLNMDILLI